MACAPLNPTDLHKANQRVIHWKGYMKYILRGNLHVTKMCHQFRCYKYLALHFPSGVSLADSSSAPCLCLPRPDSIPGRGMCTSELAHPCRGYNETENILQSPACLYTACGPLVDLLQMTCSWNTVNSTQL